MDVECPAINGTSISSPPKLGEDHRGRDRKILRAGRRKKVVWNACELTWL